MKSIILLLLLVIIGLSKSQLTNNTITWDITNDCSVNPGCNWNSGDNWIGNDVPSNKDTVIIDLRNSTFTKIQKIIINDTVPVLTNIYIYGVTLTGNTPNVQITFSLVNNVTITVNNAFTSIGATIIISGGYFNAATMQLNSTSMSVGSGSDVTLTGDLTVDALSTYSYFDTSSNYVSGMVTFYSTPKFLDKSQFIVSGPLSIFNAGISSEGFVHLSNAILQATCNFQTLSAGGNIDIFNHSMVYILGTFGMNGAAQLSINAQGLLQVSGSGTVNILGGHIDFGGVLSLTGSKVTLNNLESNGQVLITSANAIVADSTFTQLVLPGTVNIEITDSTMILLQTTIDDSGSSNVFINLLGNCNINNLTSIDNTYLTVLAGAVVSIIEYIHLEGSGSISVVGSLKVQAQVVYAGNDGFFLEGPMSQLTIDDSTIYSPITVNGGGFTPTNIQIYGLLTVNRGYLALSYPGADLICVGGFHLNQNGTIYIFESQPTNFLPPFSIQTTDIILQGSLIVTFENSIMIGGIYPLIQAYPNPNANFTTVSPLYNSQLYQSQNSRTLYIDDTRSIGIEFYSPTEPSHKLAGWKVFLIILSIFIVLGGGAYAFFRYKRGQGYIAIN